MDSHDSGETGIDEGICEVDKIEDKSWCWGQGSGTNFLFFEYWRLE